MTEQLHFHFSLSCIGEGNGNPLQCSCLENSRDGGAWWAAVYGVAQSRTRLKWLSSSCNLTPGFPGDSVVKNLPAMQMLVRSLVWEYPLEKEMATHSSILVWEFPCTEEPGGLQSKGSQRVGHNWAYTHTHTHTHTTLHSMCNSEINSKWFIDLHVWAKTIYLLEEHIWRKSLWSWVRKKS